MIQYSVAPVIELIGPGVPDARWSLSSGGRGAFEPRRNRDVRFAPDRPLNY
jgi:hypothetical protein